MPMFNFPPASDGDLPAFLSTSPNEVRHALSLKEGWRQFVETQPARPRTLTVAQMGSLDPARLAEYNHRRFAFHRSLVIVRHPQLETAWTKMSNIVNGQYADDGSGMGVAVTGGAGFGKTAISVGFLRIYEQEIRAAYPAAFAQENEFIPVAYSSLLRGAGLKSQMQHILGFFGHPMPRSASGAQLADELIKVLNLCRTKILCLDQAQNLHVGNRKDEEVAAYLKEVMDAAHVALILTGIDIDQAGPLAMPSSGGRLQTSNDRVQLARRFAVVKIRPLASGSTAWQDLMASIEQQLVLAKARPGDLSQSLANLVWELSNGAIGVAFNLLRVAANTAISDGTERITRQTLRATARTLEADRLGRGEGVA